MRDDPDFTEQPVVKKEVNKNIKYSIIKTYVKGCIVVLLFLLGLYGTNFGISFLNMASDFALTGGIIIIMVCVGTTIWIIKTLIEKWFF
jgi:Mg2+ and Co2+ transporter CorA